MTEASSVFSVWQTGTAFVLLPRRYLPGLV